MSEMPPDDAREIARVAIERERRANLQRPADFMIVALGDAEIDPEAVRLKRESRRERDRHLKEALDDLTKP